MLNIFILLFFIYSFVGWILEEIYAFHIHEKFINRGSLMGPLCPLYGVGCLALTFVLHRFSNNILLLFILSMLICSVIEYLISYLLEKLFSLRWWDYSNMKFNINGRICLETTILFGIIGILVVKYINPFLINILTDINIKTVNIITLILVIIFTADLIISSYLTLKIKDKNPKVDATEYIKKYIHENIKNIFS